MGRAIALFDDAGQVTKAARLTAAQWRKTEGMDRAERHADEAWKVEAARVLEQYLRDHEEFFVDDFWSETNLERPFESRALGPLIQKAARSGWMVKTGKYRPSVASNLTPKPVWRSTLWTPTGGAL